MYLATPSNINRTRYSNRLRRRFILHPTLLCALSAPKYHPPLVPTNKDIFFPRYVPVFEALDVVNAISIVLVVAYCLLWTTILYRSPKFRLRSRYVVGTAVALFLWHLPGFITLVGKPDNVLCDNSITRGSDANHLCLAQGFLFIFSTHAVVHVLPSGHYRAVSYAGRFFGG